jgi:hypothetical protein
MMFARPIVSAVVMIGLSVAMLDTVAAQVGDPPASAERRVNSPQSLVFDDTNLFRVDRDPDKARNGLTGPEKDFGFGGQGAKSPGQLDGCASLFAPRPMGACK